MGKNKLKKFAEMETMQCVFQFPFWRLESDGFALRGKWHSDYFHNDNPIVLELGCGRGEYTVGLARRFPNKNFIGVDIKGARMWTGAGEATKEGLRNVAFLRTDIELITSFFAPNEVGEIWITFPDPQMKKVHKRLTSARFLRLYSNLLVDNGLVHLKTDSPFLYTYTDALVKCNSFEVEINSSDLYGSGISDDILEIKTYYERQWLARGKTIKYIKFRLPHRAEPIGRGDCTLMEYIEHINQAPQPYTEPDIELEEDDYRAIPRFCDNNPSENKKL